MSGVPRPSTPQSQLPYIRRNATLLAELPAPGERWQSHRISNELANQLVGLRNKEIVRRVDRVECAEYSKQRCLWETDSEAYQQIQDILGDEDLSGFLPCGHSAIRNERGVDGITCGVCDTVHNRDEVIGDD